MNSLFAHSDASFKNGISTHSYILRTYSGRKIKETSYVGYESDSMKAEIDSLVKLLNYCAAKDYRGLKIYSDCKHVVDACYDRCDLKLDITYLKHMLKKTKSKLKWKPREFNSEADRCAKKLMRSVENKMKMEVEE